MATAVRAPSSAASDRRPAALLPVGAARLLGYALLASLGALEWQRMVAGISLGRAVLWVLVGALAGGAVLACDRLPARWRAAATIAVGLLALPAAWLAAGLDLGLFRHARWAELGDGMARGMEALSNVKLPYEGADPWPGRVLSALGSLLCVLAGVLAVWPRGRARGYPFLSLVALLVLVAVPVVSLGGTQPVLLGLALAALTVVFLLLERLPLRPGLGVAALLGLALAGALPIGAAADKEEPWFDYKAFAEGLGPEDPLRFSWSHGDYGPISWTRTGAEVLRVATEDPFYWKVETLDRFDGVGWMRAPGRDDEFSASDVPEDYRNQPGWTDRLRVSIRALRGSDVVGAGTILDITDSTRPIVPGFGENTWIARSDLRSGDSYTAEVYVPRPAPGELAAAPGPTPGTRDSELTVRVPLPPNGAEGIPQSPFGRSPRYADVRFAGFDDFGLAATADYPQLDVQLDGRPALRQSPYARTWRLAQDLRQGAETPYAYALAVNAHLRDGFRYDERPRPVPPGTAPLDGFLFDTKVGYCQHYSAAMALLLRMGGVPARVATGFSPGGYSKTREAWIVRDTDAHSWVEAWFEGIGWVSFDPTPPATPARSQIAAIEEESDPSPAAGEEGADDDADAAAGSAEDSGVRGDLLNDPQRDAAGGSAGGDGGRAGWLSIAGGCLLAGIALAAGLAIRERRRGDRVDAERAIAELQRALRRTGREAPTGTTLAQIEQKLNLSGDAARYLRALRSGRYAPAAPAPSTAERRALRRDLADGLGPIGRLRVLSALPPRPFTR